MRVNIFQVSSSSHPRPLQPLLAPSAAPLQHPQAHVSGGRGGGSLLRPSGHGGQGSVIVKVTSDADEMLPGFQYLLSSPQS